MEYSHAPENVTIDQMFRAYSSFGTQGLIQLGYFESLKGDAGSARKFTVTLPVVGNTADPLGDTFLRGHIDFSSQGLTEAPLLLASLSNVSANCVPTIDLYNVTKDGADFCAKQANATGGATPQLNGTLTVVALK
jgi:hypothetical protein